MACSVSGTEGTESMDEAERYPPPPPAPPLTPPSCCAASGAERRESSSIERREMSPRGRGAKGAPVYSAGSCCGCMCERDGGRPALCLWRGWWEAASTTSELVREM
eukprot:scaffold290172_cov24-Tisochrysis_lutea.AAC.5